MSTEKKKSGAVGRAFHEQVVERMARDIAYWKLKAYQATQAGMSDTLVEPSSIDPHRALPSGTRVRFVVGKTDREWVDIRVKGDEVQVMAGDCIAIEPRASNTISIKIVQR
jgi:FtsP/CotA-like multicopper oxidase with cupredoxin domain